MLFSNALERLARLCSILGGLLMTGLMLMTCYSLIGRNVFDTALIGDFELTGIGSGAAIAFFMPLCQFKRENIIVDFFTAKCSELTNEKLDRFGALLMAFIFAVLTWRTTLGGLNSWTTKTTTMMMGFPEWIVYSFMVPAFALTCLIALAQTFGRQTSQGAHA